MVISSGLPRRQKLKNILEVTTNVVVVVFAVVAIGVLVKNHFAPPGKTSFDIKKGGVFPQIAGVDYKQAPRTLILALNVDCRYCSRSLPFYNSLAEARQKNSGQFNIIAAFINKDAGLVKSYVEEKHLSAQAVAGIDLDQLGVHMTPAAPLALKVFDALL